MYLSYHIVDYNFLYDFFKKIKQIYSRVLHYIGVIGITLIFILSLPLLFILFTIFNISIRKRHFIKLVRDFEKMDAEKKHEFYIFIKEFNRVIRKPILFILLWGLKPVFAGVQAYIERKYFSIPSEILEKEENKHIIEQMHKEFAEDWETEELDIYNFYEVQ